MAAFIIYIIRWAVCLTLLYSLFGLFLKRETLHGMNRIVLLAILVASMVLPLCQIETGRKNIVTQGREMIERSLINQTMTHPQPLPVMEGSDYLQDTKPAEGVTTPPSTRRGVGGEALLKHELAHIRLGHSWDMLLCELTCRMLWFVPFAWMLRQDLRDVHEYQADRRVLQGGIRDEEYQLLLIKKATSTGLQPGVNAFNQSPIKRRFKMMYRKPSRRWVALKAAYLLPLSALAVVAFARPQTLSEIEEKVETEVAKAVAPLSSPEGDTIDPAHKSNEAPSGAVGGLRGS